MSIRVRGDGVASLTCSYLLQTAGFNVTIERISRTRLPALMLNVSSQALFCDMLQTPDTFADLPRIETRIVKWGANADAVALPHSAVIVSEDFLLDRIAKLVCFDTASLDSPGWTVVSSRLHSKTSAECAFGKRTATVVPVQLDSGAAPATCWIESVDDGWLFLLPDGSGAAAKRKRRSAQPQGWLMSVGEALDTHLAHSELVAAQVAHLSASPSEFPAHPSVRWPLAGSGWLACGSAALAF